jgi:phospholipid/cholesterol/gamma-HCH transport system permease protein
VNSVARLGAYTLATWLELRYLAAMLWTLVITSLHRQTWVRTVRNELRRQIYTNGVKATRFILYVSIAVGISVVSQALVWMQKIGQPKLLGPLLVTVLIREAAPVLTNLLAIGRNGTSMTLELGQMNISGEVRMLDAQGLDPFIYLVLPRVLGLSIAVFCLNLFFLAGSLISGYLFSALLASKVGDPVSFLQSILVSIDALDLTNFLVKSLLPALCTGVICCHEGLSLQGSAAKIPGATKRALANSVRALFLISALVSLLTYI